MLAAVAASEADVLSRIRETDTGPFCAVLILMPTGVSNAVDYARDDLLTYLGSASPDVGH